MMKRNICTLLFCVCLLFNAISAPDTSAVKICGGRVIVAGEMTIDIAKCENSNAQKYTKKQKNGNVTNAVFVNHFNTNSNEWEEVKFAFIPQESGRLRVSINGFDKRVKGKSRLLASYYDNLKVNGKLFKNGDFEKGLDDFSYYGNPQPRIISNPKYVKYGKHCLRAWSGANVSTRLDVEAGKRYEISVMTRPAGELLVDDDFLVDLSETSNSSENQTTKRENETSVEGIRFSVTNLSSNAVSRTIKNNKVNIKINNTDATGEYLYLLHRMTGAQVKDNAHFATVAVITADGKRKPFLVRFGVDCVFKDDYKPAINAKAIYFEDEKNRKGAWYLSRFKIDSNLPIASIEFGAWKKPTWEIAAVTISDKNVLPFEIWEPSSSEWTVADIPENVEIIKGSALDLSGFYDGKDVDSRGRVIVSDRGTFAFKNSPEKDVRFKGFTMSLGRFFRFIKDVDERKAALKKYAEQIRLAGYNCVRMEYERYKSLAMRESGELDAVMDCLDYFFAELKKNGIYHHLVFTWQEIGLKNHIMGEHRDDVKLRCIFCEPEALEAWKRTVEFQLNHVNPYTGLAWKDDPMFLQVEHFNELSISLSRLHNRATEKTREFVHRSFRNWLKEKYGTIEKLNETWNTKGFVKMSGSFKYKSFDDIVKPFVYNPDWQEFALIKKTKFLQFCNDVVRATGYDGIIASENITSAPAQNPPRARMFDSIVANTYFTHPSGFDSKDVTIKQKSIVGDYFSNLGSVVSRRIADRPIGITEYNYCWWNFGRYEILGTFTPYAAFQNMSMLVIHENAVPAETNYSFTKRLNPFTVYRSPILRAAEVMSSCFFIRGDVKPSRKRVDIVISEDYLKKNKLASFKAMNTEQMKLSLLTALATDCQTPRPQRVSGAKVKSADMRISPIGSSDTIMEAWFHDVVLNKNGGGFDLKGFVQKMREKNILPNDNLTDVDKGIFQTDTGEIIFNAKNNSIKISTEKSQLAVLEKSEEVDLGDLKIESTSTSASIAVTSLDDKKISESGRLMLIYATVEANSGMKTSFDKEYMITFGKSPILIKNGVLRATLKLDALKKFAVYPLALNGERRAPIPTKFENGILDINIDNSKLPNGSTTMFEIAEVK